MQEYNVSQRPGATINYAIFLCVASVLFVSAIAYVGNKYTPELTAWNQDVEIDDTIVASINKTQPSKNKNTITKVEIGADNAKTYRVFQLPKGLRPAQ
ncbi:MAG: hypothetical protein ABJM86_03295 [Hyphomicrobiales bacterium]